VSRRWTEADLRNLGVVTEVSETVAVKAVRSKYGNQKMTVDGRTFDSTKEARRYIDLRLLEKAGVITNLECQPVIELPVCGVVVARYLPDFSYSCDGVRIVEDVKSVATRTPIYRLKVKLVKAVHGIEVREVL